MLLFETQVDTQGPYIEISRCCGVNCGKAQESKKKTSASRFERWALIRSRECLLSNARVLSRDSKDRSRAISHRLWISILFWMHFWNSSYNVYCVASYKSAMVRIYQCFMNPYVLHYDGWIVFCCMETAPCCPDIGTHTISRYDRYKLDNHADAQPFPSPPLFHIISSTPYTLPFQVCSIFVSLSPTFTLAACRPPVKPQFPVGSANGMFSPPNFIDNEYVITIHFRHPISSLPQSYLVRWRFVYLPFPRLQRYSLIGSRVYVAQTDHFRCAPIESDLRPPSPLQKRIWVLVSSFNAHTRPSSHLRE